MPDRVAVSGRARQADSEKEPVAFELTVEVNDHGRISFGVPEATVDLRIATAGMAPAYRWQARPRDGVIDLGNLELRPGGSILGYVVDAQTGGPVDGAVLRAVPAGVEELPTADQQARVALPAPIARSDPRGAFQLVSLPPGAYRLQAEHPDYLASLPADVSVIRDAETVLGGDVTLSRPLSLRLTIDPPRAPEDQRWEVVVVDPASSNIVARAEASPEGGAELDRLAPGSLRLVVGAERMTGAHQQDLVLASDLDLAVDVPLVEIHGRVTMEDEPVQGEIRISTGGGDGWSAHLDEEGRFESWLRDPRFDFLHLEISGDGFAFPARVIAEDVVVRKGRIALEVELLDLEIAGTVVSLGGEPVAGADVHFRRDGQPVAFTSSEADGSFSIRPLQAGEYTVFADQRGIGASRQEPVTLSEYSAGVETELVIHPSRRIVGRLTGPGGEAVGGARVMVLSAGPSVVSHDSQSDVNGRFVAEVAPEAHQAVVQIAARGYPFWAACLPASQTLNAQLPAAGGWLELNLGDVYPAGRPPRGLPMLVNELGGLGLFTDVFGWARQQGGGDVTLPGGETVFRIPNVASGRWGVTWSTGAWAEDVAASCNLLLFHATDWQALGPGGTARLTYRDGSSPRPDQP